MKIVHLEGNAVNPGDLSWDVLNQFGDVTVYERTAPEEAAERIGNAEVVLINKTPITAELLEQCPNLRLICVQATGYNVVDCDAARARDVLVCNVPTYGTNAVAQFTFSLLLELCNQVGHHDRLVRAGKWCSCPSFCFWDTPQMELADKTIGIIGFGRIGRAVGKIAAAFGMKVLAYNRSRYPEGEAIGQYVDLDTLLKNSDIVSLHCPLTAQTSGLINTQTLAKMKNGAILLNTARGALLDESTGKLRGAAVDVVSIEPMIPDNPLRTAPNCIITPHMAWTPAESRQRIIDCTVNSIQGYLSGNPVNTVN